MARPRLPGKLLLAAASLLILAALGAWLAARPQAKLPTIVRGGARPGLETRSVEEPAPPAAGSGNAPTDAAAPAGGDLSSTTAAPGVEGTETLGGIVVTPEGAPIAGARVDATPGPPARPPAAGLRPEEVDADPGGSGRTDARGRFAIDGLVRGHYNLEVTAPGFGRELVAGAPTPGAALREGTLRIVLHPELWVRGEVVDRRAQPVAGAEITLTFLAGDSNDIDTGSAGAAARSPGSAASRQTRADAGGRFRIGGLARGVYRAEARGEGRPPATAPLVEVPDPLAARDTHLVLELEDGHTLRGVVRTVDGEPLAGASVSLRTRVHGREIEALATPGQFITEVASGADGSFELASLPAATYRLVVSSLGYRDRSVDDVTPGGEPLEIVLEQRSPLEGLVVDRTTGDPVPDAEVSWQTAEGMDVESGPAERDVESGPAERDVKSGRAERTDAAGRFRIERFPEDGEALRIEAEGYSPLHVDAAPPEDGSEWTIALARSGTVSGRVRAARRLPVDGLRVSLVRLLEELFPSPALLEAIGYSPPIVTRSSTDAGGFYCLFPPGAGSYRVVVEGGPYAAAASGIITVPDPEARIERVDIILELAARADGFVFSREFGGVAGVRVRVIPERTPEETEPSAIPGGHAEARADATGAFTVGGLSAGAYRIIAGAPGYITARSESFHVAAGGTHAAEIELEPEMLITGRVSAGDGAPILLAEVHAAVTGGGAGEFWSEERALSSAAGTFRLSRLAPRPYDLRFAAGGFAPAVMTGVAAGRDDVDVRLDRLVSISGRVAGAFTGEPAVEFKLRLQFEEEHRLSALEKESLHAWRRFSDPGGAFRIDDVPPGRYLVEVAAHGHIGADARQLEVPEAGLEGAEILLEEAGLVTGVVVDGHQNGVAGALVEALVRWTDPDTGRVSYRPFTLPRPPRPEGEARDGESRGGESRGGERRGRRRDGEGRDADRAPAAVKTGGDGSFVLRGLPDGVYRVSVTHDDYLARELGDYVFENGRSGDEPLQLSFLLPFGVVLLGRVRGADLEGGPAGVYLRPATTPDPDSRARRRWRGKTARVDAEGHFEIRGLEVGDYVLEARLRKADGSRAYIRRDVKIHGAGREQGILLDLTR